VCIDLMSDDDAGGSDGAAAAAATAAGDAAGSRPARAQRTTRAGAYRSTSDRFKGMKCLFPPAGGPGAVEVTHLDLPRLDPDEFLNDTVIDFYIRWVLSWRQLEGCFAGLGAAWAQYEGFEEAMNQIAARSIGSTTATPSPGPPPHCSPALLLRRPLPLPQVGAGAAAARGGAALLLLQHFLLQEAHRDLRWVPWTAVCWVATGHGSQALRAARPTPRQACPRPQLALVIAPRPPACLSACRRLADPGAGGVG
jgi:hypothetical protein